MTTQPEADQREAIARIEARFHEHYGMDGATDSIQLAKDCKTLILALALAPRPDVSGQYCTMHRAHGAPPCQIPRPDAVGEDWTGGRAWPDMLEAIAQYWSGWEENRAGTGAYSPEELAEDSGEFANGLADHLGKLALSAPDANLAMLINEYLDNDGSRGTYHSLKCHDAREKLLAALAKHGEKEG